MNFKYKDGAVYYTRLVRFTDNSYTDGLMDGWMDR